MEFELNSNDGTSITFARDEGYERRVPSFGPGGEDAVYLEEEEEGDDDVEELEEDVYSEDLFEYPEGLIERMGQVSQELLRLREALGVERECLRREAAELEAASDRGQQLAAVLQKERYFKQMMEVDHMCSEEFLNLNTARAKMVQLNREISDWRLSNGSSIGFAPYPMEVMIQREGSPMTPLSLPMGPSSTIPGRFTVNQPVANAGIRSVPNVNLPIPEISALPAAYSFQETQPWVQVLPSAQRCVRMGEVKTGERSRWKSGDAEDRLSHVVQF